MDFPELNLPDPLASRPTPGAVRLFGAPDSDSTDQISINRRNRWISLTAGALTKIVEAKLDIDEESMAVIATVIADAAAERHPNEIVAQLLKEAFADSFALASYGDERINLHFRNEATTRLFIVRHIAPVMGSPLLEPVHQ